MVISDTEIDTVLKQVESWPAESRIKFVRRVMETLEYSPARRSRGSTSAEVLGILNPSGATPPDDEECARILAEELERKYSP